MEKEELGPIEVSEQAFRSGFSMHVKGSNRGLVNLVYRAFGRILDAAFDQANGRPDSPSQLSVELLGAAWDLRGALQEAVEAQEGVEPKPGWYVRAQEALEKARTEQDGESPVEQALAKSSERRGEEGAGADTDQHGLTRTDTDEVDLVDRVDLVDKVDGGE